MLCIKKKCCALSFVICIKKIVYRNVCSTLFKVIEKDLYSAAFLLPILCEGWIPFDHSTSTSFNLCSLHIQILQLYLFSPIATLDFIFLMLTLVRKPCRSVTAEVNTEHTSHPFSAACVKLERRQEHLQ